jgi:hypothetical protein
MITKQNKTLFPYFKIHKTCGKSKIHFLRKINRPVFNPRNLKNDEN